MLHPGVVLRAVVAQHHKRVRPDNAIQAEEDGSRKQRRGVLVPALALHLVLLVMRAPILEIHDDDYVPFFEGGNRLVEGFSLQLGLAAVWKQLVQDGFDSLKEVIHSASSPDHYLRVITHHH